MSRNTRQTRRFVVLAILVASPVAAQQVRYVDTAASGPVYDGSSWCSAFRYLQDALAVAAGGDEIRVADGIYRPDLGAGQSLGDRDATFQLISGVAILGGYAGCAALDPDEHDFLAHDTILSGDLLSNDGPNFANYDENTFHVVTGGTDASSVIDGFTIMAGLGISGAGMLNDGGAPTVSNCIFLRNWAESGGGMGNYLSSPTVTNCTFRGNRCNDTSLGGGVANYGSSDPLFANCTFLNNSGGGGGGMSNFGPGALHVTLVNCVFSGNRAEYAGGGVYSDYEGPSTTIINSTFSGNIGGLAGGGVYLEGMAGVEPAQVTLTNCVLWNNTTSFAGGTVEHHQLLGTVITVNYSCIQGLSGDLGGVGNIGGDPLFADADGSDNVVGTPDDDLHLALGSPCVDAGDNSASMITALDFEGEARIQQCRVDMGVDETPFYRDCNANTLPDACEIADGDAVDCNANGVPDDCDIQTGVSTDCNLNDIPDECDFASGASLDCNANTFLDECDIAGGTSPDCNSNLVPDECETLPDGDGDGVPDCADQCPGVDDALFAPGCSGAIPAMSTWGIAVLTLFLMVGAKLRFARPNRDCSRRKVSWATS